MQRSSGLLQHWVSLSKLKKVNVSILQSETGETIIFDSSAEPDLRSGQAGVVGPVTKLMFDHCQCWTVK